MTDGPGTTPRHATPGGTPDPGTSTLHAARSTAIFVLWLVREWEARRVGRRSRELLLRESV